MVVGTVKSATHLHTNRNTPLTLLVFVSECGRQNLIHASLLLTRIILITQTIRVLIVGAFSHASQISKSIGEATMLAITVAALFATGTPRAV